MSSTQSQPTQPPAAAAANQPVITPAEGGLIVSSSPHFHTTATVSSIMLWVVAALLPGAIAGLYFFGLPALRVILICSIACPALEYVCCRLMDRKPDLKNYSALVTGLLLAMNLPSTTPWWICLIGSFLAIVVGKMLYGGLGCNPFNPALVGRVALLLAFPAVMSTWTLPAHSDSTVSSAVVSSATPQPSDTSDAPAESQLVTCATPLAKSKQAAMLHQAHEATGNYGKSAAAAYWNLAIGRGKGGSLGETCALALLAGGILLICLNIVRWQIPFFYLLTVAVITGAAWLAQPDDYVSPLYHLLSGGLMLGAVFMATDMVTTPLSRTGAIIFAVGCGVITSCIRLWGNYPEGVSFSILIMNAFTPLIDRHTRSKPFGMPNKKGLEILNK